MCVGDFVQNGVFPFPQQLQSLLESNSAQVSEIMVPAGDGDDELIWEGMKNGVLTVKEAYSYYRDKGTTINWHANLGRPSSH